MTYKILKSTKSKKVIYQITLIIGFSWTAGINLLSSRLDPDPLHDGIILSSAMALKQGKIPNLDFFSQYGPVTNWINSLFINISGYELLTLRVSYFVLAAAIATILIYSVENKDLRFLVSIAFLIWLTSNPVWSSEPTNYFNYWPWPDLLDTLILSLIYFINIKRKDPLKYILIGFLVGISFYVKINFGVINSLILGLWFFKNRKIIGIKNIQILTSSFVLTNATIIAILYKVGSLTGFINNCIIFPFQTYHSTASGILTNVIKMSFNPFTLFIALLLVAYFYINDSQKFISKIILGICTIGIIGAITLNLNGKPDYFSGKLLYLHLSVIFVEVYAVIALKRMYRKQTLISTQQELSLTLAICAILNLVYIGDIFHLWLNAPLVLLSAFSMNQIFKIKKMIYLILGVLLVFNSYSAIENIVEPRVSMNQTPLKGMLVGRDQNSGYQKTNRLLKSLTNKKVDYVCPDGLFHVVTGKYQPDNYNPWFTEVSSTSLKNPNLVVCIQNKDWIPKYIIQNYTLIAEITDKTSWSHWSSSNILYFRKK